MKRMIVFLVILIFFVPLVLSGQIDTIHTVSGWKITQHTENVRKASLEVVNFSSYFGSRSLSVSGSQDNNSFFSVEKTYGNSIGKSDYNMGVIWLYVKKMDYSGYLDVYVYFGNDSAEYGPALTALLVPGSIYGSWYPISFSTENAPGYFNKIKLKFVSHGTYEFVVYFDVMGFTKDGATPDSIFESFEDTTIVGVKDELTLPVNLKLFQNYPNPFNPQTSIKYEVSSITNVILTVYDMLGREVETLVNEEKNPGEYKIQFNGSKLPSGTYFYRLSVGNYTETKKMLLIK